MSILKKFDSFFKSSTLDFKLNNIVSLKKKIE